MRKLRFACASLLLALGGCSDDGLLGDDYEELRLRSFGYWGGFFEWVAKRSALTDAQREAIAQLRLLDEPGTFVADKLEVTLVAVDAAGDERRFYANEANGGVQPDMLDFESLKPLLATLNCLATGNASETLASAQTLQAGDGCRHGFFSYEDSTPKWVKVKAAAAGGAHRIEVQQCGGKSSRLELFDEAGATLIAEASGDDGACAGITHALESGRVYALKVTTKAVTTGGHVLLEITPAP